MNKREMTNCMEAVMSFISFTSIAIKYSLRVALSRFSIAI